MFFFLSLSISLMLVITAINWKTYDQGGLVDLGVVETEFEDILEVPMSQQPPPPPPPQKVLTPQIVEVSNEEIIEEIEIDLDVEMMEEAVVEEVEFIAPVEEEEVVEEIFTVVETWPSPKGGMGEFYKFLGENVEYPAAARRLNVTGRVFLRFVVEKDGVITDIKVLKGIGAGCDEEAVRVLSQAPAWEPGKQRGRAVRVYMTIPVNFILADRN
ncbi:MAG: energy transducer TonB [Cyclobacteriaceae bacterium]